MRLLLFSNGSTYFFSQAKNGALILTSIGRRWRANADQRNFAVKHRGLCIGGHCDLATGGHSRHEINHALFHHRRFSSHDQVKFCTVDINTDHIVTVTRQAGQRHRPHIAQSKNADLHATTPLLVEKFLTPRSMMPSRRSIERGQAWWLSMRCRPATAKRLRSAGLSTIFIMACAQAAGVSATRKCVSESASTPPAAMLLVTTGTPIAMASRILFCVPRAMFSG